MKKIIVLTLLVLLAIPAAAWAGESARLSFQEEVKIQDALQAALNGYGISETRVIHHRRGCTVIEANVMDSEEFIALEIQSRVVVAVSVGYINDGEMVFDLENKINAILNPSASVELQPEKVK